MWITSLCSFPPLFTHAPIALDKAGASVSAPLSVPVTKKYPLILNFEFPSVDARLKDEIVGSRHDENCLDGIKYTEIPEAKRLGLGRPIPIRVVIRKNSDKSVVVDHVFNSLCITSHIDNKKTRTIGWLDLAEGNYTAEVISLEAQSGLEHVKTSISLVAGYGK